MEPRLDKAFSFIPSIKFLIDEVGVVAYGSFVRFFATYPEDQITEKRVNRFISRCDIDMYINLSFNHDSLLRMRKLCKHVFDLNGHIEYIGCSYDCDDRDENEKKEYDPFKASVIKYGYYCIWIPTENKTGSKYIKIDLLVKSPVDKLQSDYTINALEYGKNVVNSDQCIQDLCDQVIRPFSPMSKIRSYDLAKRLYRMKKVWDKKYRPKPDSKTIKEFRDAFERIRDFDGELKFFKAISPSYEDHQPIIRVCKHRCQSISMTQFHNDPTIQEIKMWLK